MTWFLLLGVALLATRELLPPRRGLEGLAYLLLFGLVLVPFGVTNLLFLGKAFASIRLLNIVALAILGAIGARVVVRSALSGPAPAREVGETPTPRVFEGTALVVAALVACGAWHYYSDAEFLLSLGSYLQRGEAECFYMQTFSFVPALNPGETQPVVDRAYTIINTPGNTLFTASLMPLLGASTFHLLYVAFHVLLFLFSVLLVRRCTGSGTAALAAGLFAVANPYVLSLEVLDRNFIALALSAATVHTLLSHPSRALLVGGLLGLTAASGLRFLPLTLLVPAVLLLRPRERGRRWWGIATLGFASAFAFNLPHLAHHGFHSLGETEPLWRLGLLVVTDFVRTPLLPYPNLLYYPVHLLSYLGALVAGLIVLGAVQMAARDRRLCLALGLVLALPYLVLACQRDWIQGDKSRILVMAMLPLVLWFGQGLAALLSRDRSARNAGWIAAGAFAALLLGGVAPHLQTTADPGSAARHPVYQGETDAWSAHYRRQFTDIGLMPSLDRLFQKTDVQRKSHADTLIAQTLFGPGAPEILRDNAWVREWMGPDTLRPVPVRSPSRDYAVLRIDLEKLGTSQPGAVTVLDEASVQPPVRPLVDLETEDDMLARRRAFGVQIAAYHKQVAVSWQPEPLQVTVLSQQREVSALGELAVDLNAWRAVGRDEFEFQKLQVLRSEAEARPGPADMTALPQIDTDPSLVLRIPRDLTVLVRAWVLDGRKGLPHRVDAWRIRLDEQGEPEVGFYCLEPESYL